MHDDDIEPHDPDGTPLQASDPRENVRNVVITVDALWPAGYGMKAHERYDFDRWSVRQGVLILCLAEVGEPVNRVHIPLTSIARWSVTR